MGNKFNCKPESNKSSNLLKTSSNKLTSKTAKRKISQEDCKNQIPKRPRTRTSMIKNLINAASKEIGYSKRKRKFKAPPAEDEFHGDSEESQVVFPQISATNWKHFEDTILQRNISKVTKKLNACNKKMQCSDSKTHFTGFRILQTAIVDALLNRKWDNLLQLTVMLGRNYFVPMYRIFIRNLCQILKLYHPGIRGTEYEDQLDLIVEKYTTKNDTNNESVTLV